MPPDLGKPSLEALAFGKPSFEEWIGDVGPFLRLRRELSDDLLPSLPPLPWILVENVSSFPVCLMPTVTCGRYMREWQCMPNKLLEPGETYKLTRFSLDEEGDRMDCYASHLPHLVCEGISRRVDPTRIRLMCQPAARDSEGWYAMSGKDGIGRPEVWVVYIDAVPVVEQGFPLVMHAFLEHRLVQTCTFLDDRRPATRIFVRLDDIRFCQDSCGQTFRDGRELKSTVEELKNGQLTVAKLGIRVVALGSVHFAMDNRRLKCVKLAFSPTESIPVLLVDLSDPVIKEEWESKFTAGKRISTHEEARRLDLGPKGPNTDSGKGKGKQTGGGKGRPRKKRGRGR